MAESQGKNRRVAWFENSVHPGLWKAGDELPKAPDQPAGPKPERMLTPFNLPRFASIGRNKSGTEIRGDPMDPNNPPSPVEVGNHVIARLKAEGMPHEPDIIHHTVRHLMQTANHPQLTFTPGKGPANALEANTGWKLRLNTGKSLESPHDDLDRDIIGFLTSQGYKGYGNIPGSGSKENQTKYLLPSGVKEMGSFKYGSGGDQWPEEGIFQNYTIYTGGRQLTDTLARKLENQFGSSLSPNMSGEEALITPHVGARFVYDNGSRGVNNMYDTDRDEYHNGSTRLGVPLPLRYFREGNPHYDIPSVSNDDAARAHDLLWSIVSPEYYGPPLHQKAKKSMKTWFENSVHPALRKSEENQPPGRSAPEYDKDRPGRIWSPAHTASFFSPDPEINRRMKVSNALALTHSLLDYQDPNDFLDHEDPSKRAYAKFLLHHVVRDTAAHPIDDSWLESVRDILGEVDHGYEKAALDGLPDKEGIEKHNQEMLDTYVEKPAHPAVKRALAAGYRPAQSDAFGDWEKKGALAYPFSPRTPGTGGGEDDDNEMSGKITFFPSTHEDFVNAGTEPPPGIGHDPTPTTDVGWFFKSMNAKKGAMMKSRRDNITSQVRKEEQRQGRKIHKEEKAEMRGVEHEVDHGIKAHEDKVMKLIAGVKKAYTKDQAATLASIDRYLRKAETDTPSDAITSPAPLAQAPKPVANGKFSAPPQGFQLNNAVPANKPNNSLLPVVNYGGKEYGVGSVMSGIGKQIAQYTNANRAANPAPAAAPNPNVGVGTQGIGAMATTAANALTGGLWGQGAKLLGQQSTPTAQTGGGVTATRSPMPSAAPVAPAVPAPAAKAFSKSQKEVLDRMDRWKKKTEEKLLEEEGKLADRIHSDHTGPGVPKFVGKYTHGVKQHEKRLKRVIDKLRDDEEAEVKEEMDDQESACSRCGKDPCLCGMEKSSRKKWPSFNVQSHQIAKREGVSEKDADAMLASRGRNHRKKR